MKKLTLLTCIFLTILALTSCEKLTKTSWVYFDETYCADPWGDYDSDNSKKTDNVKKYLKDNNIRVFKVQVNNDGTQELCKSCGCKSGNRIKCKIKSKDKSKAVALKFYE